MDPRPGQGERAPLLPWQVVTVTGPSMVPTLRDGDRLLVHRGARAAVGDVVLARFDDVDGLVVKRVQGWHAGGRAELASDNAAAGGDSRTHGPGEVLGRVVLVRRGWSVRRPSAAPELPIL